MASVTIHEESQSFAAELVVDVLTPRRLKNLTLSGLHGPPFWETMDTSPQGLQLSLAVILDHFTEGMTGHLHVHNLDLSLLDDDAYEQFLQLVDSAPGRSGATSINLGCLVFRTITDVATLLTRCSSARTVRVRDLTILAPMEGEIFASDVQWDQKKVFIGRGGQVHLFYIMLDEHVRLDNLKVLVVSDITQQTMLQLREVLRKAGGALHVLSIPLLSCDLSLLPSLDLTSNSSLRVLTISHGLGAGNPIQISSVYTSVLGDAPCSSPLLASIELERLQAEDYHRD
ncbi:uncharacterized protein EV420DRAFT_1747068 [Desarmillaria tabescens]|uniref:Uncharacterized protein n=1 Tax=Armillaria tabescens TaxID=1929756 RepID=A0AA39N782_ARMTA|nr:uncharacterized protein EV420DRAFT_1747068 [Desarmillaria tabescens]KAK0460099.1 hypothetical protein EV420DRAFT_1747068 [Desarmillaria tabescens]